MSDYANEYTKSAMKAVLPELLTELATNTVFSKIIGRMCPQGIDVAKMGRVGGRLYGGGSSNHMENSVDGLMEVRRTLHTDDNISIKLAVHRAVEWKTNTNRTSTNRFYGTQHFTNKFSMYITIVDNNFKDVPFLRADLYNHYYGSKTLEHTQGTLNQFILRELAQSFDPAKVIDTFDRRVKYIKDLNLATAKYL